MIQIENVSFFYNDIDAVGKKVKYDGVFDINLQIKQGECVVLCGKSGCGKTTLLRMINGLIPHFYEGELQGKVFVAGCDIAKTSLPKLSECVGSVFQNPRSQFFHLDTTGELAFNIENQGLPVKEMKRRVTSTIKELNLSHLMERNIFELSGGEKQRIACGTVYAAESEIIVFDEPSSNLDVESIFRLKSVIEALKRAGKTIVVSEHRLWYLWGVADRYVYMEKGMIKNIFTPQQIEDLPVTQRCKMGIRAIQEEELFQKISLQQMKENPDEETNNNGVQIVKLVCKRKGQQVIEIKDLNIPKHAVVAVIGANGVGKSTFCYALSGLLKAKGKVFISDKEYRHNQLKKISYLVMQEAGQQLFADTVQEELMLCDKTLTEEEIDSVLGKMNLSHAKTMHPGALSGGEKQRLALATALCTDRKIRFYDEPTSGQDMENLAKTVEIIRSLAERAEVSFVVTHDLECISQCATHILYLNNGRVEAFLEYKHAENTRIWKWLKERNKTMKKQNGIGRLLEFTGKYRGLLSFSQVLSAISAVFILIPFVCVYFAAKELVGTFFGMEINTDILLRWGLYALLSELLGVGINFLALLCSHVVAFQTEKNLKMSALTHLSKMPLGYFEKNPSGKLRKIIDENSAQTQTYIAHQMPDLVGAQVTMLAAVVLMLAFDWKIGVPILVLLVLGFLLQMTCMGKETMEFMKIYQDSLEDMNHEAVEYVRGISVVKVFGQSVHSIRKFKDAIESYKKYAFSFTMSCKKGMVAFNTVINAAFAVLVPMGLIYGKNTTDLKAFLEDFLFYVIFSPATAVMLNKIMYMSNYKMQATEAMRRIDEILSSEVQTATEKKCTISDNTVTFKNVSFTYEGALEPAVKNVSFVAKEGTMTALVGHSGSGKSTIASLIPRFYDVSEGTITIGGTDIRDIPMAELMEKVSFVFQNPKLFKESIYDNIRAGKKEATREEVLEAVKLAQCQDIVDKMPQGIDTVVGKEGVYLSGGEVQRISIARAILKNAPILVLDEATAYADTENEMKITEALLHLMKGKTILMIAHRLGTVKDADQILVMSKAELKEVGTHEELVQKQGEYDALWTQYNESIQWNIGNEVTEC